MKKLISGFALILFAIILLGCFQPDPSANPKEAFRALITKSVLLDDYYTKHSAEMTGQYSLAKMVMTMEVEGWKKNKNSKTRTFMDSGELYGLGGAFENTTYLTNGLIINCAKENFSNVIDFFGENDANIINCQILGNQPEFGPEVLFSTPKNFDALLGLDIKYIGEKKISGKYSCHAFEFNLTPDALEDIYSSKGADSSTPNQNEDLATYTLCLEKETGVIAEMKLTTNQKGQQNSLAEIVVKLVEFRKGINENEFELPVNFSIGAVNCDNNSIEFDLILFKEISEIKASILAGLYSGRPSEAINLERIIHPSKTLFETQEIIIPVDLNGFVDLNFCYGNECHTSSCYSYFD